ncbi:hypothetical protein [Candidatus Villigracilis affinis]|uniref:hypothetical protein n=1 Tax=Candidatus Villigracilis affinis TaxID=3140682 RepID=UPI001DB47FC7|nr:hypothetical protein [Anaerolineales bacterium]
MDVETIKGGLLVQLEFDQFIGSGWVGKKGHAARGFFDHRHFKRNTIHYDLIQVEFLTIDLDGLRFARDQGICIRAKLARVLQRSRNHERKRDHNDHRTRRQQKGRNAFEKELTCFYTSSDRTEEASNPFHCLPLN